MSQVILVNILLASKSNKIIQQVATKYSVEVAEVYKIADEVARKYSSSSINNVQGWKDVLKWEVLEKEVDEGVAAFKASKIINTYDGVANYLKQYGKLPDNFITKSQAEALGRGPGKDLSLYAPGKSIGGDTFKNIEGYLPSAPGRIWYEADIGYASGPRGSSRMLRSSDGLYYTAPNHYENGVFKYLFN